ncbi:MAG: tetratricopeptide repeat protein [Proteobacteria bacterium]|nr:tetratricopeptide repeat protein [Pseudomonadota bacterium]
MVRQKVTRKELLKSPDEFLTVSAKAVAFVREHAGYFTYAGVAVVAALAIYFGIHTYLNYVDRRGQNAYNEAYNALIKNMGSKTNLDDLKGPEGLFQKVIDDYGRSEVSRLAKPQIAYLRFLDKRYDEAIPLYEAFLKGLPEKSPYRSLTRLSLAACYEEKGDHKKAVEILKEVTSGKEDLFKEQAMLSLARLYRLTNQAELAKGVLREFVDTFKSSPFLAIAKAHLDKDPS